MSFEFIDGGKISARHYYGQKQHTTNLEVLCESACAACGSLQKLIKFLHTKAMVQ